MAYADLDLDIVAQIAEKSPKLRKLLYQPELAFNRVSGDSAPLVQTASPFFLVFPFSTFSAQHGTHMQDDVTPTPDSVACTGAPTLVTSRVSTSKALQCL